MGIPERKSMEKLVYLFGSISLCDETDLDLLPGKDRCNIVWGIKASHSSACLLSSPSSSASSSTSPWHG